tara:strand:- start:10662 stop:11309 length:648 start_codon:yes stop_codon:yes gene_type:complete
MTKTIKNPKHKQKHNKTKKKSKITSKNNKNKVYNDKDFKSKDGMLTSVWGPSLWHYLHTMSFNYPVEPTDADKKYYKQFVMSLKYVLPCKYCRMNLRGNLKAVPLTDTVLKNRANFSRWMYDLHEHINTMLKKKSGLSFEEVRERYEHFRARCSETSVNKIMEELKKISKNKKEKGCETPLYGHKSKCVIKIVPKEAKEKTFQMDNACIKQKIEL